VFTKGYERMTIQGILADLKISSGAFYHYFKTKPAVLEALIERMQQQAEAPLLPIVREPNLTALEKLQRFFGMIDRMRAEHKAEASKLWHVWYTDENAIVRQKIEAATIERRTPLLVAIIQQGIETGTFSASYPEQTGELILRLLHGMGNSHANLFLAFNRTGDEAQTLEAIIATHVASMEAIERVLGIPSGSLYRVDIATAKLWLEALRS
jgi:AcrR family transcriptional regulator